VSILQLALSGNYLLVKALQYSHVNLMLGLSVRHPKGRLAPSLVWQLQVNALVLSATKSLYAACNPPSYPAA